MTSSYQINFNNQYLSGNIIDNVNVVLPPTKQTSIHKQWLNVLLQPIQRLNDLMFNYYDFGSSFSFYSASNTYHLGDRINGGLSYQNSVFECSTSSTTGTFSTNNWFKILPTFIGYEERLKYLDSRIVFEYALNKYFRTTFRQPNFDDTLKSDIYISTNNPSANVFLIGTDDFSSSFIGVFYSTRSGPLTTEVWIGPDPVIYPGPGEAFIINITATAYGGFPGYNGSTNSADSAVRNFADTINYAGMPYLITVY